MSGIAEVMLNLGYTVRGSDARENPNVERLRKLGAQIYIGQKAEQVHGAGAIVMSSAIKKDNVELVEARTRSIPIVRRAEMLAELMRLKWAVAIAGTHGMPASIAVVTNIDPEHMEHYGTFDNVKAAYRQFIHNLPFYGYAVLCIDHPEVQALVSKITDRRVITYGFNPQADVRAENVELETGGSRFDVVFRSRDGIEDRWDGLFLPMAGKHNTQNVLSTIAVARELNISEDQVRSALAGFGGVKRRFTHVGEWNGVTIIDDYGHHPVEIKAVLQAARQVSRGKVHAVVQPHRYSRLKDLFEEFSTCFNDADAVYVADVYAAGEAPIEGASGPDLVTSLGNFGHKNAVSIDKDTLAKTLKPNLKAGDLIVCLGAGDITYWAADLADGLSQV